MYSNMWKRAIANSLVESKPAEKIEIDATTWIDDYLAQTPNHYAHIAGQTAETARIQVLDAVERGMLRQGGEMVTKCQLALVDEYRLVYNVNGLFKGRYMRWISAPGSANAKLTGGGFLSNIVVSGSGIQLTWVSANRRRAGCVPFKTSVVFQALTQNEKMCLDLQENIHENDEDESDDEITPPGKS